MQVDGKTRARFGANLFVLRSQTHRRNWKIPGSPIVSEKCLNPLLTWLFPHVLAHMSWNFAFFSVIHGLLLDGPCFLRGFFFFFVFAFVRLTLLG